MISTHSSDLLKDDGIALDETLLLVPDPEGTAVQLASTSREIELLVKQGATLADTVIPHTRPQDVQLLLSFAE